MQKKKAYLENKWMIAGLCFLMVFVGLGFCSSSKSIYISAITDALGFSRSAFSINDSCRFITTTIVNLFFGNLVTKYGTKKLITAGMVSLIISSLLYSFAKSLFVFYLGGVFLGLGVAWTTTTMVGVVINKWFKKNKGTVMGIVLASNGIGAAVAVHIVTPIIYENKFGYQNAYLLTAVILLAVTLFIMALYKENPSGDSETTEEEDTSAASPVQEGIEYEELIKKPYFYGVMIAVFLHMLTSLGGITTPYFTDIGLSPSFVASTFSIMVILLAVFKFITGMVYDKLGIKFSTNLCLIAVFVSKVLLLFVTNSLSGKVMVVVYCVIAALATPIETVMLPVLALSIFGEKAFSKTLGILTSVATAGQALGIPLLSLSYDLYNSYYFSFLWSALASVIVVVIMNWAMKSSEK